MSTPMFAVANMPPQYLEEFNASRAYIANITDVEYARARTYGMYTIRAKNPGEAYSLTEIGPRRGTMDFGDKHVMDFPITPDQIAKDLVREINGDAGFDSFLGVFVCGPNGPSADELANQRAHLEAFYTWCVGQGDEEWQRTGRIIMIPDLHKRAATYLKLNREWCAKIQPQLECPGCGDNIRPGVAVCKSCGAVIDRGKAIALGILRPEPEEPSQEDAFVEAPAKGKKRS